MSFPIITVENLSKKYTLRHLGDGVGNRRLTEELVKVAKHPLRSLFRPRRSNPTSECFWALRDVSFKVRQGEVLGIIGRNGAGKSTLLKILSRITLQSTGKVTLRGRVSSLLEVGTGFHPELTGRENIFLNGAILGMTRAEIHRKFDEIVAFAEVEKFLDTPVKHYSSGMYMRLAFAVAAHLEPEILIVDEVLAVGDAAFQKKCLGKMRAVAHGGRTVLFVSHNIGALSSLCASGLLLQVGEIQYSGPIAQAIELYSEQKIGLGADIFPKSLCKQLTLAEFTFSPNPVISGGRLEYRLRIESTERVRFDELAVLVYSSQGVRVGIIDLRQSGRSLEASPAIPLEVSDTILLPPLVEGEYSIGLVVFCPFLTQNIMDLLQLSVTQEHAFSVVPYPASARGLVEFTSQRLASLNEMRHANP